jgi:hypothetical protein
VLAEFFAFAMPPLINIDILISGIQAGNLTDHARRNDVLATASAIAIPADLSPLPDFTHPFPVLEIAAKPE